MCTAASLRGVITLKAAVVPDGCLQAQELICCPDSQNFPFVPRDS